MLQALKTLPRPAIWSLVVAGAAVAGAARTLGNGFVYDDVPQVVRNEWIRDLSRLPEALLSGVWRFEGTASNYYRPLMHLLHTGCYQLFGLSAPAFHAFNVLLHASASVVLFFMLQRVLSEASAIERPGPDQALRPGPQPEPWTIAVCGAAASLFAVHPALTEAVAWVSAVPELSFTLCALAALLLSRPHPRRGLSLRREVAAASCFFVATLGKETAFAVPAIVAVWDLTLDAPRPRFREMIRRLLPFAIAAIASVLLRVAALGHLAPLARHSELDAWHIALNGAALFARSLWTLLVPVHLSAYHPFDPVRSLTDARALAGLAAVLGLAAALGVAWRRNRATVAGLAACGLGLLPVLYVPVLGENAFAERYLYFPATGLALAVAAVAGGTRVPARRRLLAATWAAAAIVCLAATISRSAAWHDDLSLWSDAVHKEPAAAVARYNLGVFLERAGRFEEAAAAYREAIRLQPAAVAWNGLARVSERLGLRDEARAAWARSLELAPDDAEARLGLERLGARRR